MWPPRPHRGKRNSVSPAAPPAAAQGHKSIGRRFVRPAVFAVVAGVAAVVLLPKVPRSQQVRLHLGVGSSRVVSATARIGRDGTWDRETTWRFDHGAPASIDWSFDLANGPAQVEVELQSATSTGQRTLRIDLRGGASEVELAEVTRGLEGALQ
jgi:hypothetical protein